jgi:outer membrane protein OmpA-like peptidoglycan-associated protein
MEPNSNVNGTLGLGQVVSAEAMGLGRLALQIRGNLYQQGRDFPGAPPKGTQVTTVTGAVAYGLSPYFDAFVSAAGYNLSGSGVDGVDGGGPGTVAGGVQASAPFSETIPARLGIQLAVLSGTSGEQINSNAADGHNYFETREGTDFSLRLTQSLLLSGDAFSVKLHLNEGVVTSLQENKYALLQQSAGVELSPHPSFILGLELHSRTFFRSTSGSDPFWISPSFVFRSQSHVNAQIGSDFSLSQDRDGSPSRALEPWRVNAALTFSIDLIDGKAEAEAREKARRDSLERLALEDQARRAQALADSLSRKAREDSLALAQSRLRDDSLARKAREDSLALAEARRKLEEERASRSDWEREFLRTGVLNLEALYFETGKAEISINSKPYLNLVGKVLAKYPKLRMEIGGHTDNTGSPSTNLRLSQDRADAVRLYLTAENPELAGRLGSVGYGPNRPKESNRTAEGRQINRRVEILVLNKDALKEYE